MELIGVQMDIAWEDVPANLARAAEQIDAAAPPAGSLVVLPEMFSTGFTMNLSAAAQGPDRAAEQFLARLARQYNCTVLGGVATMGSDGRGRNEAVAFDRRGKLVARYAKLHSFSPAGEKQVFSAGERIIFFEWQGFTACPFICYDLRFPEAWRLAARRGANLFILIASWPAARQEHWRNLLLARAIENQAYVFAVNRCGSDPQGPLAGGSLAIDPHGHILAEAGPGAAVIRARPDLTDLLNYRQAFPALADIRPDALGAE
jgi:omega-amidase